MASLKKEKILEILKTYGLSPNKKLGQNFLVDQGVVARIVESLGAAEGTRVLEIGPGLGALTGSLLERTGSVTVVEIDAGFVRYLKERFAGRDGMEIIHGDILRAKVEDRFDVIVSNFPYYCASEIIFRLAADFKAPRVFVMVQKELARRMVSRPGDKNYGALTVNASLYFNVRILFNIGQSSFYPRPDVISSFLMLERRDPGLHEREREIFHSLVKSAFWGRRKTIARALAESPHLPEFSLTREKAEILLDRCHIAGSARGEDLGLDDYLRLTEIFSRAME